MYKFLLLVLLIFINMYSKTIEFDEVLKTTLQNNNKLKLQELNIETLNTDIKKVKAISYGTLNFISEFSRTNHAGYVFNSKLSSREATFKDFGFTQFGEPIDTQPIDLNHPKDRNNFNSKITYDIPLFTGFKLSNQKEFLKLQQKAQYEKLNLDKKSLEFEVLRAYNAAVVAKEFIQTTKKAKELMELLVQSAAQFHKEGLVTKIDIKQAKVHELNIRSKLNEAKNRFNLAIAYLKFLSSDETIEDVGKIKTITLNNKNIKNFYKVALKNRDDLKMISQYKKSMKKNIILNKSSYYPSVYSHLEYGTNDGKVNFDDEKDYYLAMIGIKFTLFDSTREYDVQKSKIEFNKTAINQTQLEDAIKLQLKEAVLNLQTKNKIYKEKIEANELANEVLEQSKLMYKNQLISMTDLLKQEVMHRETQASMIQAKYEKSIALGNLYLTLGKSLKENK